MEADRYPFDLLEARRARNGRMILIRPILPDDERIVQAFVRNLSPRSRYQRFHNALKELSPELLHRATHVDYDRHLALIAETFDDALETEIGAARYVLRRDGASGEFAVAVSDAWQGQGLGKALLEKLIAAARERGLQRLEGEVLHDNKPMLTLAGRLGFRLRRHPEEAGLFIVSRELQPAADAFIPLHATPANLAVAAA